MLVSSVYSNADHQAALWHSPGEGYLYLIRHGINYGLETAAASPAQAEALLQRCLDVIVPLEVRPDDANQIFCRFWFNTSRGGANHSRVLTVDPWEQIAGNYAHAVQQQLERLILVRPLEANGHLILLHGAPGGGKTHLLLALAYAWRKQAYCHYITDSEQFFGSAAYMHSVLFQNDDDHNISSDELETATPKANLIIIEDAAELISTTARAESGQGLGRLLNLTDGFIGRGTHTIVLITTNEPIGTIHPAIIRKGRCLAEIAFTPLSQREAEAWAATQGVALDERRSAWTLSDLYALKTDTQIRTAKQASIGFRVAT